MSMLRTIRARTSELEEALENCVAQLEVMYRERAETEEERAQAEELFTAVKSLESQVRVLLEERNELADRKATIDANHQALQDKALRVLEGVADKVLEIH